MASRKDWKPDFIAALAESGNITLAARAAGVGRRTVYDAQKADESFAAAWAEAEDIAADLLEEEARKRAVDGTPEPVYYKGQMVGAVRRYSDNLLMFLLKARRPERFRDRSEQRISGSVGVTLSELLTLSQKEGDA